MASCVISSRHNVSKYIIKIRFVKDTELSTLQILGQQNWIFNIIKYIINNIITNSWTNMIPYYDGFFITFCILNDFI